MPVNAYSKTILPLLLSILLSTGVSAGDLLDSAIKSFERRDYQAAWKAFQKLARQGEVTSQRYLGEMYDKGYGVQQDYDLAVSWYRKAAEKRDAAAQYHLGLKYANGHGVPEDPTEAYVWFAISFDAGYQRAADPLRVLNKSMSMKERQQALDLAQKKMLELAAK